jgi:hypothetical protein
MHILNIVLIIVAALVALLIAFWAGWRYGSWIWREELGQQRKLNAAILKERNELKITLEKARSAVSRAGLDVKKVFPWLMLLLSVGWAASCGGGGGTLCWAQGSGVVRPALPVSDSNTAQLLTGTSYSPETNLEKLDVTALASARNSIYLVAFSLTDKAICDELAAQARAGVPERIYLDRGELQAECRGDSTCARIPLSELIGLPGVEIRVKHSKMLMHLKSYVVDKSLIRDGSANFSEQGERSQDNSASFSADPRTVAAFAVKFRTMWDRPDNLTVAQALVEAKDKRKRATMPASAPGGI